MLTCTICERERPDVCEVPISDNGVIRRVPLCTECAVGPDGGYRATADEVVAGVIGRDHSGSTFENFYTGARPEVAELFDAYNAWCKKNGKREVVGRQEREVLAGVRTEAIEWAEMAAESRDARLVLSAPPGAGKSHLAAACCRHLVERGLHCEGISAFDFIESMYDTMNRRPGEERRTKSDVIARLAGADALFIEDLTPNTFNFTDAARRYFSWLFKEATASRRVLVVCSQLTIEQLEAGEVGQGREKRPGLGSGPIDRLKAHPMKYIRWASPSFNVVLNRIAQL